MLGDGRGTRVKKRRERGSAPKPTTRSPAGRAEHHFWQPKRPGCCSERPHATARVTAACFHKNPVIYKPISRLLWGGEG